MSEPEYRITMLTGEAVIKPVEYWVEEVPAKTRWWQRPRSEFWIACEFSKMGSWPSREEARAMLLMHRLPERKYAVQAPTTTETELWRTK